MTSRFIDWIVQIPMIMAHHGNIWNKVTTGGLIRVLFPSYKHLFYARF